MKRISSNGLREMYQQFFERKGHARLPSAPLVPENDPSVLFTTAGMHPLVPYLKGQPHPAGKRLTDVQKCLRTTDIDSVGDATHATVFEMLGNWSLGDYFKEEAIAWSWEFLTGQRWLGIDPARLAVSVFAGNGNAPRDDESAQIWQRLGVARERVAYLGMEENWWPAGGEAIGPQGPDTEMFYWTGAGTPPREFNPEDARWVEIWNDVFMQYNRTAEGVLQELAQRSVDTGMGLERTIMVLNELSSIYDIDTYDSLLRLIQERTLVPERAETVRHWRILADHLKAATFVLADEVPVLPSNTGRGYVVRRIVRRAAVAAHKLEMQNVSDIFSLGLSLVIEQYAAPYASLKSRQAEAIEALQEELEKFEAALRRGFKKIERDAPAMITGHYVFGISSTYAVPADLVIDYAEEHGIPRSPDIDQDLKKAQKEHQEKSRTAATGQFAGGLADHSVQSIKYHTATHLLHQALRDVLGTHVLQRGSNITPQRLRFDFSHPDKLTDEQIGAVERTVNKRISDDLPVTREEMTVAEARARGALGLFGTKYGERVSVYAIGNYSLEICGGPHAARTGELGSFKIVKEESAGAGVRRVKALLG